MFLAAVYPKKTSFCPTSFLSSGLDVVSDVTVEQSKQEIKVKKVLSWAEPEANTHFGWQRRVWAAAAAYNRLLPGRCGAEKEPWANTHTRRLPNLQPGAAIRRRWGWLTVCQNAGPARHFRGETQLERGETGVIHSPGWYKRSHRATVKTSHDTGNGKKDDKKTCKHALVMTSSVGREVPK